MVRQVYMVERALKSQYFQGSRTEIVILGLNSAKPRWEQDTTDRNLFWESRMIFVPDFNIPDSATD